MEIAYDGMVSFQAVGRRAPDIIHVASSSVCNGAEYHMCICVNVR